MSKLFIDRLEIACKQNVDEETFLMKVTEDIIVMYSENNRKIDEMYEIFNKILNESDNTILKLWLVLTIHVLGLKTGLTIKDEKLIANSKQKIQEAKKVMLKYMEE
jgi:hypothetical protein